MHWRLRCLPRSMRCCRRKTFPCDTARRSSPCAAPSSTKNEAGQARPRDASGLERQSVPRRETWRWHFGMKVHIGADAESGLVHTVIGTAANANDVTKPTSCCTAKRKNRSAMRVIKAPKSAQTPLATRVGTSPYVRGSVACSTRIRNRRRSSSNLNISRPAFEPRLNIPSASSSQFGFTKVRYRGLAKNTAALITLFALSNLWMVRRRLLAMTPEVCP